MQDLLDEFDPLSLNQTNKLNTISIKPINPSQQQQQQTLSSSSSKPLFDFNPTRPAPVSNTSSTTSILTNNKTIQSTTISSSDPLDAFCLPSIDQSSSNSTLLSKSDQLLIEAKQRDKLRKEALEKHLSHVPFEEISRPSSPLITLTNLETNEAIKSPKPNSFKNLEPSSSSSIKIPTEYFQNQHKSKPNQSNSPKHPIKKLDSNPNSPKHQVLKSLEADTNLIKVDQEKLAAALEEDFDEFVSSSNHPPPRISKPMKDIEMMKSESLSSMSFDGPEGRPIPIKLIGINPTAQSIMDEELAEGIRLHLPTRLKISSKWELIYSIDQHGTSLSTLYTQSNHQKGSCILILKDHTDHRFGAFLNESLKVSNQYYGTGECFLWKSIEFDPSDFRIGFCVKKYEWTGINDYMILSDHEMLSVGGGDGKFGLWIDSNLEKGISTNCSTFNNEILSNSKTESNLMGREIGSFDILGLECWRILV